MQHATTYATFVCLAFQATQLYNCEPIYNRQNREVCVEMPKLPPLGRPASATNLYLHKSAIIIYKFFCNALF